MVYGYQFSIALFVCKTFITFLSQPIPQKKKINVNVSPVIHGFYQLFKK